MERRADYLCMILHIPVSQTQVLTDSLHQMIRLVYLLVNATLAQLPAPNRDAVAKVMLDSASKYALPPGVHYVRRQGAMAKD